MSLIFLTLTLHRPPQAHTCAAIVNFSENCEKELIVPYLDTLITKLMNLLQHGKKLVQEGALTAMASVADCAQVRVRRSCGGNVWCCCCVIVEFLGGVLGGGWGMGVGLVECRRAKGYFGGVYVL